MWTGARRWTPAVFGGALLLLGAGLARAEDRALLVGLERYADPRVSPTPGGTEDARSVARTLEHRFDFKADNIKVLLDEQATAAAIVADFEEWLIHGTDPGDRVFFLYAGHGSQLRDQDGDESDGFDETLAPFDVNPMTGEHQIRDDTIDALIAQLSGRRAVLLFDSCHSGTLTRSLGPAAPGAEGVRYLPRPDQIQASRGRRGTGDYRIEADASSGQKAFDAPGKVGRVTGVVAISASGPGQLAYPVEVNGEPRGALSYLFEEAVAGDSSRGLFGNLRKQTLKSVESTLKKTTGTAVNSGLSGELAAASLDDLGKGMTIAGLEVAIDSGMKHLQQSGRLEGNQSPWFEVLSEQPIEEEPLFGGWEQAAVHAMSNPIDDRQVTLRTVGDQVVFERGESIVFEAWSDRPGYLYLLVFSEGERATCIFPNPADAGNRVGPAALTIPTHGGYRLPAQAPFGRDLVVALVSDGPMDLCRKIDHTWDEVFEQVELTEVHRRLQQRAQRGIGVDLPETSQGSGGGVASAETQGEQPAWQTAVVVLRTVDPSVGGQR